MSNIEWKVGDVVELAGRRGKLIDGLGMGGCWKVEWQDIFHNGTEIDCAILDLSRFPEAKKIEPPLTFTKTQVEAIKIAAKQFITDWNGFGRAYCRSFFQWLDEHTQP